MSFDNYNPHMEISLKILFAILFIAKPAFAGYLGTKRASTCLSPVLKQCTILFLNAGMEEIETAYQSTFEFDCIRSKDCLSMFWSTSKNDVDDFNRITDATKPKAFPSYVPGGNRRPPRKRNPRPWVNFVAQLSHSLYKVLGNQRYHQICLVRFPRSKIVANVLQFSDIDHKYFLGGSGTHSIQPVSCIRYFAVVSLQKVNPLKVTVSTPYNLCLTFIFINVESNELYSLSTEPNSLHTESTGFQSFRLVTFSVDSLKNNVFRDGILMPRLITSHVNTLAKTRPDMPISMATLTAANEASNFGLLLFLSIYNCSKSYYRAIAQKTHSHDYDSVSGNSAFTKSLVYGRCIHEEGIKYIIISATNFAKPTEKNLAAFLWPFDLSTWILMVASFCLTGLIIKLGQPRHSLRQITFWLLSTLIEQEDDGRKLQKRASWLCILIWILVCNFVRNFYTSDMYSDLTTGVKPLPNVPGLGQILRGNYVSPVYETVATNIVYHRLMWERIGAIRHNDEFKHIVDLVSAYLDKLIYFATIDLLKSMESGIFERVSINGNVLVQANYSNLTNYIVAIKSGNISELVYSIYLPVLAGKKVYENDDLELLQSFSWYQVQMYSCFVDQAEYGLGKLYSSGMVDYLEEIVYKSYELFRGIKKVAVTLGKNVTINVFTYARLMAESEFKSVRQFDKGKVIHKRVILDWNTKSLWQSVHLEDLKVVQNVFGMLLIFPLVCFGLESINEWVRRNNIKLKYKLSHWFVN